MPESFPVAPSFEIFPAVYTPSAVPELERTPSANSRQRALVMDDDPVPRELLCTHLQACGLNVCTAETIGEARRILRHEPIDLAVLDVHMPDGSGIALSAELDSDPATAGIPIIILSGEQSDDIVRRARAAGGRFFLAKPYDPAVLFALVESLIDPL